MTPSPKLSTKQMQFGINQTATLTLRTRKCKLPFLLFYAYRLARDTPAKKKEKKTSKPQLVSSVRIDYLS